MGASQGQTVTQEVDPQYANRLYTLYSDAQQYANQTPYVPYQGQQVAGLQPMQQAAQSYLSSNLLGQNLGFASPTRYQTSPYGTFTFSSPQDYTGQYAAQQQQQAQDALNNGTAGSQSGSAGGAAIDSIFGPQMSTAGFDISGATIAGPSKFGPEVQPPPPIMDSFNPNANGSTDIATGYPYDPTGNDPTLPTNTGTGYGLDFAVTPGSTVSGSVTSAQGPWGNANQMAQMGAQGVMGYNPQQVDATNVAAQTGAQGMGAYQNAYEDQVVNQSLRDLARASDIAAEQSIFSKGAGTFGGDRMGVQASEAHRNYLDRAGALAGQLRSAGFDTAAANAQTDASRFLQAGGLNQAANLNAALANQSAGLTGAGLNLSGANSLNQIGTSALNNTISSASALNQMGAQNQQLAQNMLNADMNQFYEARDYPMQQFGLMQGILSGVPVGMSTYYPGGSRAGGMAGGAMTGAGIGSAFGVPGAIIGGLGGGLLGAF